MSEEMKDYVVRGVAAGGTIRAFAASTGRLTEEARRRHDTSPVMTAGLGRLLTAAAMLSIQMKGEEDKLTLKVTGDGPGKGLIAVADSHGHVKGFALEPGAIVHSSGNGKLNVGGAIGKGELTVTKDLGMKEPYSGTCSLQTGEIAEDLTYYFSKSEQTPSSVALGVLMNKENTVRCAGGFMIQLMPNVSDETAERLENIILSLPPITSMLEEGEKPEEILEDILGSLDFEVLEKQEVSFFCGCSKEKVETAVASIGKYDLLDLMLSQETVEAHCDYCNTSYHFNRQEMKEIFKKYYKKDKT